MNSLKQVIRLLIIIRKLRARSYSKKELLEATNRELNDARDYKPIDFRTLERDLRALREAPFHLNVIYTKTKGYFIEENNNIGYDIEQMLEPFDILNALNADSGLQNIIFTEKYTNKGTEYLYRLIKAIRGAYKITFDYTKYLHDTPHERTLAPYAIKLLKGQWYVVGIPVNETKLKTFALDRVSNFRVLDSKFKRGKNIDINTKFEDSFGIYSSEEYPVENVVLSFDKTDGSYLKTVPFHHSQEIIEETENTTTFKLRLRITKDFIMAIVARSWSLKVIEPIWLKEELCNIYKKALERLEA